MEQEGAGRVLDAEERARPVARAAPRRRLVVVALERGDDGRLAGSLERRALGAVEARGEEGVHGPLRGDEVEQAPARRVAPEVGQLDVRRFRVMSGLRDLEQQLEALVVDGVGGPAPLQAALLEARAELDHLMRWFWCLGDCQRVGTMLPQSFMRAAPTRQADEVEQAAPRLASFGHGPDAGPLALTSPSLAPDFCCRPSSTAPLATPLAGRRPAKFGHAYFTATKTAASPSFGRRFRAGRPARARRATAGASRDRGRVDRADEAGTTTGPQAAAGPGTNPGARPDRRGRLLVRPGPTHAHSTPRLERCCPSVNIRYRTAD